MTAAFFPISPAPSLADHYGFGLPPLLSVRPRGCDRGPIPHGGGIQPGARGTARSGENPRGQRVVPGCAGFAGFITNLPTRVTAKKSSRKTRRTRHNPVRRPKNRHLRRPALYRVCRVGGRSRLLRAITNRRALATPYPYVGDRPQVTNSEEFSTGEQNPGPDFKAAVGVGWPPHSPDLDLRILTVSSSKPPSGPTALALPQGTEHKVAPRQGAVGPPREDLP